jgi:hypothetical protein
MHYVLVQSYFLLIAKVIIRIWSLLVLPMGLNVVSILLHHNGLPSLDRPVSPMVTLCHYGMLIMTTTHHSRISLRSVDGVLLMQNNMSGMRLCAGMPIISLIAVDSYYDFFEQYGC